ncbi:hypothetical protein J6590_099428 [Homalodisca vitripennis]|nr:hypothetical protein J6590_097814 [Homalodisca vitripennis]KAG8319058.1 hypothetical protein J6590_099428 [Homalodisca vitripennis]
MDNKDTMKVQSTHRIYMVDRQTSCTYHVSCWVWEGDRPGKAVNCPQSGGSLGGSGRHDATAPLIVSLARNKSGSFKTLEIIDNIKKLIDEESAEWVRLVPLIRPVSAPPYKSGDDTGGHCDPSPLV